MRHMWKCNDVLKGEEIQAALELKLKAVFGAMWSPTSPYKSLEPWRLERTGEIIRIGEQVCSSGHLYGNKIQQEQTSSEERAGPEVRLGAN